jgi:hypothetical protein
LKVQKLPGCHFLGFAFLPHQLQLALGFLEGGGGALSLRIEGRGSLSLRSSCGYVGLPEPTIEFSKIKVGQPWG